MQLTNAFDSKIVIFIKNKSCKFNIYMTDSEQNAWLGHSYTTLWARVCASLHPKAAPLPTGVSPAANYKKTNMGGQWLMMSVLNFVNDNKTIQTHYTTQTHEWLQNVDQYLHNMQKPLCYLCARGRTCVYNNERMLMKVLAVYLLNVIVQCHDSQGVGEVGTRWDSRTHWWGLAHVSLIGGELEIWCLVVLI